MKYENTKLDKRLKKRFKFDYAKASLLKNSSVKKVTPGVESPAPETEAPKAEIAGKNGSGTVSQAEKA